MNFVYAVYRYWLAKRRVIPLLVTVICALMTTVGAVPKVLNHNSIISITFKNNPAIAAARQKLNSADCNFKLFEAEYTQFKPLIFNSGLSRNQDDQSSGNVSVGIRKEFFDGSSFSVTTGNNSSIQPGDLEHDQYLKGAVEFPLFSSNRRLSRLIKRTFEENELYNANLNYVDAIQREIRRALFNYYELQPHSNVLSMLRQYYQHLDSLTQTEWVGKHPNDKQQLADEMNSLDSDLKGWESRVTWLKIRIKRQLNVPSLEEYTIEQVPYGYEGREFYGRHYFDQTYDDILQRAMQQNTRIKVYDRVIANAREKKKLAEKGKWDFFVSMNARYDYQGLNDAPDPEHGYNVGMGFKVNRFDNEVLGFSRLKAVADIATIEAEIKDLESELAADVKQRKEQLESIKEQFRSTRESLASRKNIYRIKLDQYLKGETTVDNLLQVFRSLVDTERNYQWVGIDHYFNIVALDYYCGVYFKKLGITVE